MIGSRIGNILIIDRYNRQMLQRNPDYLFVFGDNLARVGRGGQAYETRGEPNAVGIVTKISPSRYMSDDDWIVAAPAIVQAFTRLRNHLLLGSVIWPKDGVGTGLADLPNRAPLIAQAIDQCKELLFSHADAVIEV